MKENNHQLKTFCCFRMLGIKYISILTFQLFFLPPLEGPNMRQKVFSRFPPVVLNTKVVDREKLLMF